MLFFCSIYLSKNPKNKKINQHNCSLCNIMFFKDHTFLFLIVQSDSRMFKWTVIDHLYRPIEKKCFFTDAHVFAEGSLPALRTKDEGSCSQPSQIIIQLRKQVIISCPQNLTAIMVTDFFSSCIIQVSLYISLIMGSFYTKQSLIL